MEAAEPCQPFPYGKLPPLLQDPYKALSDPIRRHLLEQLWSEPRSVSELAGGLSISRPAVSQHLKILREAELVRARAQGTKRIYTLNTKGFLDMQAWVNQLCIDSR